MEFRFGIFCLCAMMCGWTWATTPDFKKLTLPSEMVDVWTKKFSEKIVTLTKNFTAYDHLFDKFSKSGTRVEEKGDVLVNEIADNIQKMLNDKVEAVKALVAKAEEIYENYTFDAYLEYDFPNNKKLLSDNDVQSIRYGARRSVTEMEMNVQSIRLEPSSKFNNQSVSNETSTVQVATNVFDGSAAVINGAYWSSRLDETFKSNYLADPSLTWQYFCSSDGYFRIFPGTKWPRDNDETGPDMFDCRMRSWYLQAATCRKNIVILIDTSGSMKGLRMQIARSTVYQILDTLTDDDYFNIIKFSDTVEYVDSCFNATMVPANAQNKAILRELVDLDIEAKNKANFEKAFLEAFDLLKRADELKEARSGKGQFLCNKAILLVTDGVPENHKWIFEKYNWPDKRTRVFTYLIGREVDDEREVKWMACANKGYYTHISTLSDVKENVQKYIKVLSRPLVISRDNIAIWTSVYLDHFSTLNISEGLKFMTTIAAPVFDIKNETYNDGNLLGVVGTDVPIKEIIDQAPTYQLGPNAFAFLINHDGYILYHPDFKPYKKRKDTGDIIMNPNYSNRDMLDVMLASNRKQLEWLKESMLTENNFRGDLDIELLVHYDKNRRMARRLYSVYYRKILGTAFRIAIALPSTSALKEVLGKAVDYDLKNCLNSSGFELAPWKYCKDTHENMTSREKIYLILEHSKSRNLLSKNCDTSLLDLLTHDNQNTLNIEQSWMDMANKFPASYGIELVFVGTKGGLTKYLNVQNTTTENYIKHRTNTIKADYYRRAVEGVEGLGSEPEYKVTLSIPLKKEPDVNNTMVTASIPIVIQDGPRKKGIRAVTGLQMKYENFAELFLDSFSSCVAYPCTQPLTCRNDSVNCFLLDNNGYVMASKTPEKDLGKFFGDVDAQVMTYLVAVHNLFVGYNFTDHQAICDIKASDRKKNSASFILNPLKSLVNTVFWTITELALFITNFSWKTLLSSIYASVTAQMGAPAEDCEYNKLADYEDDTMTSLERMTFSQLQTYCFQMQWPRDEVVGHRSCDKTFTLYRSNLSAFRRPAEDAIEGVIGEGTYGGCERCEEWSRCEPGEEDCEKYCIKPARLCTKPYIARWVEDTNLIFVMAASNCDCFADEMPFNTKPKEVNYTKEETCAKLKQATFIDDPSPCYDRSDFENVQRCDATSLTISVLLLVLIAITSCRLSGYAL